MKKILFILSISIILLSGCTQPGDSGASDASTSGSSDGAVDVSDEIIQSGDTVAVEYRGWFESGEEFDSSEGRTPLEFAVGAGQVVPGFEQAVLGNRVGDEITVRILPENAYGEVNEELIVDIPKTQFENVEDLQVDQVVQSAQTPNPGVVKEIKEDSIVIDFNHPLAGKILNFSITVVELTKA